MSEDQSFWQAVQPLLFDDQSWSEAPSQINAVLALLGLRPGADVLDLGCGIGRHAVELAAQGFNVTGVDIMEAFVREAAQRASQRKVNVELVHGDMRTFARPSAFDAVVSLFSSFVFARTPAESHQVLEQVHQSLKPGGVLLLDTISKEILAREFQERGWREHEGAILLHERRIRQDWAEVENRMILLQGSVRHEMHYTHPLYSASEVRAMLVACRFENVRIYGDLSQEPFDHTARRLVAVAHKRC